MLCNLAKSCGVCPLHAMTMMKTDAEVRGLRLPLPPLAEREMKKSTRLLIEPYRHPDCCYLAARAETDPARHPLPHRTTRPNKYTFYSFIIHTLHSKHAEHEKEEQAPNEKTGEYIDFSHLFYSDSLSC